MSSTSITLSLKRPDRSKLYLSVRSDRRGAECCGLETHRDERPHADRSPNLRSSIPDSTISALRELFVRMIRAESTRTDDRVHDDRDLRDALVMLCTDACRNGVRAEQLVIAIKQGWSSLHQERPRPRAAGPDELLNQIITLCIDEYYAAKEAP